MTGPSGRFPRLLNSEISLMGSVYAKVVVYYYGKRRVPVYAGARIQGAG